MSITELVELEHQMTQLLDERDRAVSTARAVISTANRNFDKAAVPLARKIKQMRDQVELEAERPVPPSKTTTPPIARYSPPDPEWSQEEIDHYHELRLRGNHENGKSARK